MNDNLAVIKLNENEKADKYLDLSWELKKLWNMEVTVTSFVIGALDTLTKRLVPGLEELEYEDEWRQSKPRDGWIRPEY